MTVTREGERGKDIIVEYWGILVDLYIYVHIIIFNSATVRYIERDIRPPDLFLFPRPPQNTTMRASR